MIFRKACTVRIDVYWLGRGEGDVSRTHLVQSLQENLGEVTLGPTGPLEAELGLDPLSDLGAMIIE